MNVNVFALALTAPLCGVVRGHESPVVVHAVTMESVVLAGAGGPVTAPCGAREIGLMVIPLGSDVPIPWPISTRGLPNAMKRCRACWEATGRKRPRARFVPKEEA